MQTTQQLGRYEIVAELGRGAMGAVFRARDPKIDRTVAIKTIAVAEGDGKSMEQYRERFFREAQAAGRLSHPGIVTIFDVEEDEATHTPYIVMEYAPGKTLNELVLLSPGGSLPLDAALDLIEQIALALDYAHSAGIVHRDIKPANIIVTAEGRTKIMDFGIARLSTSETTLPGHVLGTPAYMSPEQINGKPVDGRSDLFSLSVIAYWLLTGVKPFDGDTITEVCAQVVGKVPQRASELCSSLAPGYDHFFSRALAKEPAQRYQTGKELAGAVRDLRSGKRPGESSTIAQDRMTLLATAAPDVTKYTGKPSRQPSPSRRFPRIPALFYVVAAFLLLVSGAALSAFVSSRHMPATMQVVGHYPFHSGEIYIWVDGDLRYHDALHDSSAHSGTHLSHPSHSAGESLAVTLPVRAGRHIVRVQVDAPGQNYDHDTSIPVHFRAYSQKTLVVNFAGKNLDLRWE